MEPFYIAHYIYYYIIYYNIYNIIHISLKIKIKSTFIQLVYKSFPTFHTKQRGGTPKPSLIRNLIQKEENLPRILCQTPNKNPNVFSINYSNKTTLIYFLIEKFIKKSYLAFV